MIEVAEIRRKNLQKVANTFGSQKDFAAFLGVSTGYVNQLLTGHRNIGEKKAREIEEKLKKPSGYLDIPDDSAQKANPLQKKIESNAEWQPGFEFWDDNTPLNDDDIALPFFREVELSAGAGSCQVQENHGRKLLFSKRTLKSLGVSPEHAACVTVSGNSMEPILPDGATIGIDTSQTAIKNGKVYAIEHDGHLRVKRLYRMPGDKIRLNSYNKDEWPDETVTPDEIRILGKVFWSSVLWE